MTGLGRRGADRRIDNPILNSPFAEPSRHFAFDEGDITDEVVEGRRRSSHLTPIPPTRRRARSGPQAPIEFEGEAAERVIENEVINQVRDRVDVWRRSGYPNVTSTTRRLLEHWTADGHEKRFFFCQIEALETAIYLAEAAHKETGGAYFQESLRQVADDHNPGLYRIALKMATGTGNTVTHILGVRAFGTQLLAEQVVGRGLCRRSYAVIDTDEGERFGPEYAEICGIPFSFIPAGGVGAEPRAAKAITRVWAPPDRSHLAIRFPHVVGYRREVEVDDRLSAAFDASSVLKLSSADVPTSVQVEGIVGERRVHTLDDLRALRPQEVAFHIAQRLLDTRFGGGDAQQARPWLFPRLLALVREWMGHPHGLRLNDNAFVGLLVLAERQAAVVERVWAGIVRVDREVQRLRPVLRDREPWGSTDEVDFETTKPCRSTDPDRSPVTHVVEDSGWEGTVADRLEEMDEVVRYVNQGLGLAVPHRIDGAQRVYVPDFVVCVDDGRGADDLVHVMVEVSGQRDAAQIAKCATARDLWVPAVNAHGGFGRWAFAEVDDPFDVHGTVRAVVRSLRDRGCPTSRDLAVRVPSPRGTCGGARRDDRPARHAPDRRGVTGVGSSSGRVLR